MITDDLIKKRFVHEVMSQGINFIYKEQASVVRQNLNVRTGNLLNLLSRAPFTNTSTEGKETYYISILPYLRFLDSAYRRSDRISRHRRSKLSLYNRVVWGVLYHESFPQLEYGFTDEIRSSIKAELENALKYEQDNNW